MTLYGSAIARRGRYRRRRIARNSSSGMPLPALIEAMPRSIASSSSGVRSIGGAFSRITTVSSAPSGNFALVTILPFTTLARAAFIVDSIARTRDTTEGPPRARYCSSIYLFSGRRGRLLLVTVACEDGAVTFDEFVAEVAACKRSNVLGLVSSMLWEIWRNPDRFDKPLSDPMARMIHFLKAYGGRVAGLAAAICREDGRQIGPRDLLNLCYRYHLIDEREKEDEALLVRAAQQESAIFRMGEFSDDLIEHIAVFMPLHRNVRAQMPLYASWQDILRGWYLLKRAHEHARQLRKYDLRGDAPTVLNGLTPEQVVNGAYAFFVLASASPKHGGVDVRACTSGDGLATKMGLTIEDILAVTNRLSASTDEIRANWYDKAMQIPEMERKFARDPLTVRPLLRLDASFDGIPNGIDHYLCMSPRHLLWVLGELPFEIVETLESRATSGGSLQTFVGYAIEDYLADLLGRWAGAENVVRLDEVIRGTDRRGDLAVFVGERVFVIESTKTIGTVEMRSSYSARQLFDQWEVLLKKARQCRATIEHASFQKLLRERRATAVVSMVCVLDSMLVEGSLFSQVARAAKLLDLDHLEFVTVAELERTVDQFLPKQVHELVGLKWARGDGAEPLGTYAERSLEVRTKERISWPAVRVAAGDLMPEFLLAHIDKSNA